MLPSVMICTLACLVLCFCGLVVKAIESDVAQIEWHELVRKRHQHVEDAMLLHANGFVNLFDNSLNAQKLHAYLEPMTVLVKLQCSVDASAHLAHSADDIDSFFRWLFLTRSYFMNTEVIWQRYANFSSVESGLRHFDIESLTANSHHLLLDTISTLEEESRSLQLSIDRFVHFISEDVSHHKGHLSAEASCVKSYLLASKQLKDVIDFVIANKSKFIRGLNCDLVDSKGDNAEKEDTAVDSSIDSLDLDSQQLRRPVAASVDEDEDEDEWLLHLDPDEEISPQSRLEIERIRQRIAERDAARAAAMNSQASSVSVPSHPSSRSSSPSSSSWTTRAIKRFITSLRQTHSYANVSDRLLDLIMIHYRDKYLLPFMNQHFCADENQLRYVERYSPLSVISTSYVVHGDEDVNAHILTTETIVQQSLSLESCVEAIKEDVFVRFDQMVQRSATCRQVRRRIYSLPQLNDSVIAEFVNRSHEGGTMSNALLNCLTYFDDISGEEEEFCLPADDVIVQYNVLSVIAALAVSGDALLNARVYTQPNNKIQRVSSSSIYGARTANELASLSDTSIGRENTESLVKHRAVLFGFGGGQLHRFLLHHFPFLDVQSVEISEQMVTSSFSTFGMKRFVCDVLTFDPKRQQWESLWESIIVKEYTGNNKQKYESDFFSPYHFTQVLQHKYYELESFYNRDSALYSSHHNLHHANESYQRYYAEMLDHPSFHFKNDDFVCRSKVIVMDAWQYTENVYATIVTEEESVKEEWLKHTDPKDRSRDYVTLFRNVSYVDYLFLDLYDIETIEWDGSPFAGVSIDTHGPMRSMNKLKHILRPFSGCALFHIHKDKSFVMYYEKIVETFGEANVISFAVATNDVIVVATRDRFMSLDEDEFDVRCTAQRTATGTVEEVCTRRLRTPLESKDVFDQMYVDHELYHSFVHPCREGDKMDLARDIVEMAMRLDFLPRMALSFAPALDCDPLIDYDQILQSYGERESDEAIPLETTSQRFTIDDFLQPIRDLAAIEDYEL